MAKYGDPVSEFVLCIYPIQSAHTQQWTHTHTHTPWTPGAVGSHSCCDARAAVGGSVPCSRAPRSWYWRWREQLGVRCLAQGHLSRGIEGGENSWGFGVLLKDTSVVVLKVERAVGGSVPCSRAPRRGIEGGESSWGFSVLLKGTSVVVLKVERAVGGSVPCSRAPQSWYWRWREQLGVRCLAQGHLSRGIEGGESSWGFGVLLKDTSVVVLKVERAVGGSVSCSRAPQSWYWRWREQLGVRCLAQGHLVVVLKVERAVGGSVSCSRTPQSWYWRWREQLGVQCLAQGHLSRGIEGEESSWGFGVLLKGTSAVVLKVKRAVGGSVSCSRAPQSWYWRWREQLGVRCLAQGHLSRGIEGEESSWGFGVLLKGTSVVVLKVERALYIHSPTNNSCQPKTRTHNLSIMSPTLKPLGHYLKIYIFSNCSVDTNTVYRTNLITMLHYKCATNTVALFKESVKCIHGWNI